MKKIIFPAVVLLLLFTSGCKREVFLKDQAVPGSSANQFDQNGSDDKKDHGCLTNVNISESLSGSDWYIGIGYTNPDVHTKKSLVITVTDNHTALNIFDKVISNITYGSGTYNFSFPASGGGPWQIKVLSFSKPNPPKKREGWCNSTVNVLELPCIDPSQICPTCPCITIIDPVCGCNGVTYSNSCFAYIAGVRNWTSGPCPN